MPEYAELHCHSYFSLLDGAASPEDLVTQAVALGLHSLALTDHDSLAGAVRFGRAAQRAGLHAVIGAEVTLEDGQHLTLLAATQTGYANLCQLITVSRRPRAQNEDALPVALSPALPVPPASAWPGKVTPTLQWSDLAAHAQGLIALTGCRRGPVAAPLLAGDEATALGALERLRAIFAADQLYIELQHHALPDDDRLLRRLLRLAHRTGLSVVATHNAHYAVAAQSRLRDALTAIRHQMTLAEAQRAGHLPYNSSYALPTPQAMAQRFAACPAALANTIAIAARCHVSLDFSAHRLPAFVDGEGKIGKVGDNHQSPISQSPNLLISPSPFHHLYTLCHAALPTRYPTLRPAVLTQLAHELAVIEQAGLAEYFLVVWDIVRFARAQGIRCQGRGSAANSLVAYLLGITSIDPLAHNLLFERFLSPDRFTMPDIDLDFAADRREEVIQYVYAQYGHSHAAMVCNVVTYQARSGLRDLGKALAIPEATIAQIERRLDTNSPQAAADQVEQWLAHQDADFTIHHSSSTIHTSSLHHLAHLLRHIDGCPRHLAIHSGGMIVTRTPLDQIVPLEPATMPDRYVVQWDKASVEDAGLVKIDLLALRTLGVISAALDYISEMTGQTPDLDALPLDDPAIYRMLQQADTIGAFQVESRAQQQMLPRLQPVCFEDITVEVAIVRPGPIQGGAVHPYLRRRTGAEPVRYLHPTLEPVLAESLGVLLFQEQAIRVAMLTGGFTPGEADMLRRALARQRSEREMAALRTRFVTGAAAQGIDTATAEAIFTQLAGFAGYGFCKSHAASFALIAYQTLWLKRYHPAAFYCALLNQQPMGFYPPEVLVGDARRHGVDTLPPALACSDWRYALERQENRRWALRTGLCAVAGVGAAAWGRIAAARSEGAFVDLADFCQRTWLPVDVVTSLIRAGACDAWGERRTLLWQVGDLDYRPDAFDLVAAPSAVDLPALTAVEQTAWDYELMGLSPERQVMAHHRAALRRQGVLSTWQVKQTEAGRRVRVAGSVVVRQRPATAKGILFMSLEDESGLLDLVVKPETYTALREVLRRHALLVAEGVVQRNGRAASVLVWAAQGLG
jgi:error-prone DNA polymerase